MNVYSVYSPRLTFQFSSLGKKYLNASRPPPPTPRPPLEPAVTQASFGKMPYTRLALPIGLAVPPLPTGPVHATSGAVRSTRCTGTPYPLPQASRTVQARLGADGGFFTTCLRGGGGGIVSTAWPDPRGRILGPEMASANTAKRGGVGGGGGQESGNVCRKQTVQEKMQGYLKFNCCFS
jgi:hypothetical protein